MASAPVARDDDYWEWLIHLHLACAQLRAAEQTAAEDISQMPHMHHAVEVITELIKRAECKNHAWGSWREDARRLLNDSPRAGEFLMGPNALDHHLGF